MVHVPKQLKAINKPSRIEKTAAPIEQLAASKTFAIMLALEKALVQKTTA
jgi:hypothetical protein